VSYALELSKLEEYAAYYIDRLATDESATFALVEAPAAIGPLLVAAFRSSSDAARRQAILKILWQRRDPAAIPVLSVGLQDESPEVWKEALDGLVTVGGPESISAVNAARCRQFESADDAKHFREFLDEALGQMRVGPSSDNES
jgi:HEAT repeat protein